MVIPQIDCKETVGGPIILLACVLVKSEAGVMRAFQLYTQYHRIHACYQRLYISVQLPYGMCPFSFEVSRDIVTSLSGAVLITEWRIDSLDPHQAETQRRSGSRWLNSAGGGRKRGLPARAYGSRARSCSPLKSCDPRAERDWLRVPSLVWRYTSSFTTSVCAGQRHSVHESTFICSARDMLLYIWQSKIGSSAEGDEK